MKRLGVRLISIVSLFLFAGVLVQCRTTSSSSLQQSVVDEAPAFLPTLSLENDFRKMARVVNGLRFVKYSFVFGDPLQPIYFQDSTRYEYHLPS